MMESERQHIAITHCGRLPEPSVMTDLRALRASSDDAARIDLIYQGIDEMVKRQQACGVDVISDGEFFHTGGRYSFDLYRTRYEGIEKRVRRRGDIGWIGERSQESRDPRFERFYQDYVPKAGRMPDFAPKTGQMVDDLEHRFVVSGPLRYVGAVPMQRELELAKAGLTRAGVDHTKVFYPQVGVGWHSHFLWNEYYKKDEEFAFALAEALRGDFQAVVDAGFILQIDDPSVASRYALLDPELDVDAYRAYSRPWIEAQNYALKGIPAERVRYHVCWGSYHFPHTRDIPVEKIIDLILSVDAGFLSIEGASVNHQLDYRIWEDVHLPDGKILIPGVISHATSNAVEPPDLVAHRIITYARLVGEDNVIAGTDCGLGARCHDDVAWAKLASLRRGADLAAQQLWR